jgi:ppGpp synthetase/RelA/SpoT-type nucleotidyltranferase
MPTATISANHEELIDRLVNHYLRNQNLISRFLDSFHAHLTGAMADPQPLSRLVHSVKRRMKDPSHLKNKLIDKFLKKQRAGEQFDITEDNLLLRINDLGGYRILHLHTRQMGEIDAALRELLDVASCDLFEQPFAYIWDDESAAYFEEIGIKTEFNPRMYSSVHYVVRPRSKAVVTYEVQVRTLADEIWGEVDHKINYPRPHATVACREQIKALARVASSCSRLVDSIMATHRDWEENRDVEPADAQQRLEPLTIHSARYGGSGEFVDVTAAVAKQVAAGHLEILASNELAGDPCPGKLKELTVEYSHRGHKQTRTIPEGETLSLPK